MLLPASTEDCEMMVWLVFLLLPGLVILCGDAVNPGCQCLVYSATYGKEVGTFCSPDYPKPYPRSIDCILYTFIAAPEEIIHVTFKDFHITKHFNQCLGGDFVKVFLHLELAEVNEYTPWSGLLCGTYQEIPHVLYSSGPALVLELHSSNLPSNASGFIGTFRFIDKRKFKTEGQKIGGSTCDYQFVSSNQSLVKGKFYSPRYPSSYPPNLRCTYRFIGRVKERIRIFFEEVSLQKGDMSCLNRGDVVKVHEGRNGLSPVIKVICNEASSVEVLSKGHHIYIEFLSASDWPGQGFRATFEFQPYVPVNELAVESTDVAPHPSTSLGPKCEIRINSENGEGGSITSPNYPSGYPGGTCRWHFQGRGKERISVKFTHFDLSLPDQQPPPQDCLGVDSVTGFVTVEGRLDRVDMACGSVPPPPIMSNGPRLVLELKALLPARPHRGFTAEYAFVHDFGIKAGRQLSEYPCAFRFTSEEYPSGSFTSPNYPGLYPRDTECHYFFHGSNFQRVTITFHYFDIEGVPPCNSSSASDYLEFSNFLTEDKKFSRACGQQVGLSVESERKYFRVTFRSNDKLDSTGFNATFRFLSDATSFPTHARPSHGSKSSAPGPDADIGVLLILLIHVFTSIAINLF